MKLSEQFQLSHHRSQHFTVHTRAGSAVDCGEKEAVAKQGGGGEEDPRVMGH